MILTKESTNFNLSIKENALIHCDNYIFNKANKSFPLKYFKRPLIFYIYFTDCLSLIEVIVRISLQIITMLH